MWNMIAQGAALTGKAIADWKRGKTQQEAEEDQRRLINEFIEGDEAARAAILAQVGGLEGLMAMATNVASSSNMSGTSTTNYSENKLTSPEWAGANKDMQGNVNTLKALDRARLAQSDTSLAGEMTARTIREQNDAARAVNAGQSLDTRAGGLGLSGGAPGSLNPDIEAARVAAALGTVGKEQQLARQIGFENQDRSMALANMLKAQRERTTGTSTTDSSQFGTSNSTTTDPLANMQMAAFLTAPKDPKMSMKTGMSPFWDSFSDFSGASAKAFGSMGGGGMGGGGQ